MTSTTYEGARGLGAASALRAWVRPVLLLAGPVVVAIGALAFYLAGSGSVSTDDSYAKAAKVAIYAEISGRLTEILVTENQQVQKGQLLLRIDDRLLKSAVASAEASLAKARLDVEALRATYRQKLEDIKLDQAELVFAESDYKRQSNLLKSGYAAEAKRDDARRAYDQAIQRVAADKQAAASALAQLGGDLEMPTDQHPLVMSAQAVLDRARIDLEHTEVHAPYAGIATGVDGVQVGMFLNSLFTQPLFSLVRLDHGWVEANFKETDLRHMKVGDEATVTADAYPDQPFKAKVIGIGAATGSEFSLLPAQNATGNWVKVVQRIPVRLEVLNPDPAHPLRAGMSMTVKVETGHERSLLSWIGF